MRPTLVLLALLWLPSGARAEDAPVHLFASGKEGYPRYRIPSLLVAPNGDLLAACEGRKDGGGLKGKIDIVLKRSTDLGKTWSRLAVIASDGGNTLGNPCLLLDAKAGAVWMALTRSLGSDAEDEIVAGTSRERTRVLVMNSKDSGKTWGAPRDVSGGARDPKWTWYGTGPGTGVQLASGRLLFPSYHATEKDGVYRSHAVFSDDGGKTWRRGAGVGRQIGECHVIERRDGSLVLNARTNEGKERRAVAVSKDGGETWSEAEHDALFDPHCQGCLIRLPDAGGKPRWLFSNPAGPKRRDLTVRLSTDEGKTWPRSKLLRAGDAQYSSLAPLPDGTVGCLFDCWESGNYQLYFTRFRLDDLK